MLADDLPVFQLSLDDEFSSSDDLTTKFPPCWTSDELSEEDGLRVFSSMGKRKSNLDRSDHLLSKDCRLLAVYDGHCEAHTVDFLQGTLLARLAAHPELASQTDKVLFTVFEDMEAEIVRKFEKGSTALVAVLTVQDIILANLGDSRAYGITLAGAVQPLTELHNLTNASELGAVIKRGASVFKRGVEYRINGELNLSRCFGDRHLKPFVSAVPQIVRYERSAYSGLLLCTDGFYNAEGFVVRARGGSVNGTYYDNATAVWVEL